jgi:hypothetical protein
LWFRFRAFDTYTYSTYSAKEQRKKIYLHAKILFKETVVSPGKNFSNGSKFPRAGEIFCVKTPPPCEKNPTNYTTQL